MKRIAWVLTHPIQYYSPMYREIASSEDIDLVVYYFSDFSIKGYKDENFGKVIKWDIPLLDGYKYDILKNYSFIKMHGKFMSYVNLDLFNKIREAKYDLVVIHGWNTFSHLLTAMTCIVTKTPYAIRGDSNAFDLNRALTFRQKIRNKLLSYLFSKASCLFYVGEQNRLFYKSFKVDDNKLIKMPFAIDNDYFQSFSNFDIFEERKKLSIKENEKVILFTGKLIDIKQVELLIRSLEIITLEYVLVIIGSGKLEEKLQKLAEQLNVNVIFLGFVNQSEIPKYYWLADVYVMPSKIEPWGLAINEAMNCGCAIIASDKVGASDDLVKENGFIFKNGDSDDLSRKLNDILVDDTELMIKKNRSFEIIKQYSYKNDLNAILEYFEIK